MSGTGTCADIRVELGVYVLGAIAPADRAKVVRHLAACERCREELAGLAPLPALLRRLPPEAVSEPAGRGAAWTDERSEEGRQRLEAPRRRANKLTERANKTTLLVAAAVTVLAGVAGAGWALQLTSSGSGRTGVAEALTTAKIGQVTVLSNAQGYTLYWFEPDTATVSRCTGSCAVRWPPVAGPVAAKSGLTGELGTITRPDGSIQATYDGHPLYTASLDTAPGQAKGDNLDASGGIWHEVVVSGSPAQPTVPPRSAPYGY